MFLASAVQCGRGDEEKGNGNAKGMLKLSVAPRLNMLSRGVGCTCRWAQEDLLRDFCFAYDLSILPFMC